MSGNICQRVVNETERKKTAIALLMRLELSNSTDRKLRNNDHVLIYGLRRSYLCELLSDDLSLICSTKC